MRLHHPHLHLHTPFSALLPHQVNHSVKELFLATSILGFAVSAALLFEPIFLYTIGYSLQRILLYYVIMYAVYLLLVPFGARFALRHGVERAILLGSTILIFYFIALFGIAWQPLLFFLAPLLAALHKTFYWVSFHADFARSMNQREAGREIGGLAVLVNTTSMFGPLAGGALAATLGFPALFIIVAALILLSNLPLLRLAARPDAAATFSYTGAFRRLFASGNRRRTIAALGYGEDFLAMTIWPIFTFLIVQGSVGVGLISTFAAVLTSVILLYIGRLTDLRNRAAVLTAGAALKVLAWLARIPVATGLQAFLADTLSRVGSGSTEYPLLSDTYTRAQERGLMETVVHYEMALVVGKLVTMVLVLVLLSRTSGEPWTILFTLGAALSLCYVFFSRTRHAQ